MSQPDAGHDKAPEDATPGGASFPVVGIGASAGGLKALTEFVNAITFDTMAFVVVQHLAPARESLLPGILGRSTRVPVLPITDGVRLEPNHVYVAPPNADVAVQDGVLHLSSPASPMPIDRFFRSLAEGLGNKAIGVVLSGMGKDGTQGLKEIKARGGLAFAQDPLSAEYDSMPSSALESGVVDRILTPDAIAGELARISMHPYLAPTPAPASSPSAPEAIQRLFVQIRQSFRNDLSLYKPTTVNRRIERRMALLRLEKLTDYVEFVRTHHDELTALYWDILISVTSFFRDVEPFEVVKQVVVARILERKKPGAPIRIWVPACASGEEAYSLGICLLEALDQKGKNRNVQIFATDVDEEAIERARRGVYLPNIEADVSKERLQRFFVRMGENYQVSRRLRDLVVFSPQNIASDAPFSRVDLASCRNLLIYLQPALQRKVLRLLHYALVPDGFLMLGTSETVGDCADLFSLADRKNKIYVKKNLPAVTRLEAMASFGPSKDPGGSRKPTRDQRTGPTAQQIADRKLLDLYGPPSLLVDENLDVVQFRGDTAPYLAPAPGAAALHLLKLVRPELHLELWRLVQGVLKSDAATHGGPIRLPRAGAPDGLVAVDAVPILEPETNSRCVLVVFKDFTLPEAPHPPAPSDSDVADSRIRDLERDIAATKEYLQSTVEELETSNEELKSTNEELQATNEELQSTNEELETAKEELQSTNEELSTMNDELQFRVSDLGRTSSDLENLMRSIPEPVLFVDAGMSLRRTSDSARRLLCLGPDDYGRSLSQIKPLFAGIDIERTVHATLDRLVATTEQARIDDRWHELRAVPYRSPGGVVDGALLFLRDIDAEKRRQELVLDVETYASKMLAAIAHPLAIVDKEMRVLWVNEPFLTTFRVDAHATIGNLFQNLGSVEWAHPKLRQAMEGALASGLRFGDIRIEHDFEGIGHRIMMVSGAPVTGVASAQRLLMLTIVQLGETVEVSPQ